MVVGALVRTPVKYEGLAVGHGSEGVCGLVARQAVHVRQAKQASQARHAG